MTECKKGVKTCILTPQTTTAKSNAYSPAKPVVNEVAYLTTEQMIVYRIRGRFAAFLSHSELANTFGQHVKATHGVCPCSVLAKEQD